MSQPNVSQPNEESLEASQGMVITVTIENSSASQLVISQASLTAGSWQGAAPEPGLVIPAGETTYVNISGSIFSSAGGFINLSPAGGGAIAMSWTWTPNNSVIAYGVTTGGCSLVLSYSVNNASTYAPTVTYVITDPGSAMQPEKWHAIRTI